MRVLRLPETEAKVGLQRSSIYKAVSEGTFPAPIKLTNKAIAWREDELDEWLAARPRAAAAVARAEAAIAALRSAR
jgi:prophage regulatory protein